MEFKEQIDQIDSEIAKSQCELDGFMKRASELDAMTKDETVQRSAEDSAKILKEATDLKPQIETARFAIDGKTKEKEELIKKHDAELAEAEKRSKTLIQSKGEENMEQKILEERGKALLSGSAIKIKADEFRSLLVTGASIAKPDTVSPDIKGNFNMPKLLSSVLVEDHSGEGQHTVPFVKVVGAAGAGGAGTDAQVNDDTYGKIILTPSLIKRTSKVDLHIKDQTPAVYAEKTQQLALYSVQLAMAEAIVSALQTSADSDSAAMYDTLAMAAISATAITDMYLALSPVGDVPGEPTLLLNRKNLIAIGALRGTAEKKRIYDIVYDPNTISSGYIQDGATKIPFIVCSSLADNKMVFAILPGFECDVFSDVTVTTDEHQFFMEDMLAVKAECQIGGGIVFLKSAIVVTIGA